MTLPAGTRLGPYEIQSAVGAGGMGEVYRARDRKLKRDVAIKVLPDAFASDAERIARFQREAEILASLNHPNIAAIYGVEEPKGVQCLVLELVEGETLADRLKRGRLSLDQVLRIANQIAEAVEAAHGKGVVHRDLKPANIKLTPDGNAKVLDFGLAKVLQESAASDLSNSPTLVSGTLSGVILGTIGYMSPEQVRGMVADRLCDVWAFGCIFFEMLTGTPAFRGDTVADILIEITKTDPDWKLLPPATPLMIRSLVGRCLRKDRNRRLHDIADARIEIEEVLRDPEPAVSVANGAMSRLKNRERLAWIGGLIVAAAVSATVYFPRQPIEMQELRLQLNTAPTADPLSLAISPDGRQLVFVAQVQGKSQLWLRPLDSVTARPLPASEGALFPFWSPNSASIGFFADGRLKRLDIAGGPASTLAPAPAPRGGTWNQDDTIVFAPNSQFDTALYRIPATGGVPIPITSLEPRQANHRFPQFLPDGRHFLYGVMSGRPDVQGIYAGSLDRGAGKRLLDGLPQNVAYVPPGFLLFVRQGTLFAQRLDLSALTLAGSPLPLAEQVLSISSVGAAISAAANGTIVYRTDSGTNTRRLVWFDRSGHELGAIDKLGSGVFNSPNLSPDSKRVALWRDVSENIDVWLIDLGREVVSRFTVQPGIDCWPVWSPNGEQILFCQPETHA
jgi:serine/threonine protein kinase